MTRSSFRSLGNPDRAAVGALLVSACIVRAGEPRPLYPNPETPRRPDEVARLSGPIAAVDGQDVSRLGKSFALAPGCHIVRLVDKVGAINSSNSGGYVATIGGVIFALRMKASFSYEIEIQMRETSGPTGTLTIQAWERAADGSSVAPLAPARQDSDIDDCRKWTP
jgi:hypothetical protein